MGSDTGSDSDTDSDMEIFKTSDMGSDSDTGSDMDFGLGHGLGHGKFQNLGHGSDSDMSSDTRVRPTLIMTYYSPLDKIKRLKVR